MQELLFTVVTLTIGFLYNAPINMLKSREVFE